MIQYVTIIRTISVISLPFYTFGRIPKHVDSSKLVTLNQIKRRVTPTTRTKSIYLYIIKDVWYPIS